MSSLIIDEFVHLLEEKGIAKQSELQGCNKAEIEQIMAAQGVPYLPPLYREFLEVVGKKAGGLWSDAAFQAGSLKQLKDDLLYVLKIHNNPIELPPDAFVFYGVESIVFYYFLTNDLLDDPPVYLFMEVEFEHKKTHEHLSDFLLGI